MQNVFLASLLCGVLLFSGCDAVTEEPFEPAEAVLVANLAADPAVRNPNTGQTQQTGRYTLYSLRENRVVANTDSATTQWDVGFQATRIIFNGAASGPGNGGARIIPAIFDEVSAVPTGTLFAQDTTATRRALTAAGNHPNGWYSYDVPPAFAPAGIITPQPGRTILVRTADGRYAKMRILSYYKDRPASPNPYVHLDRHYSFEYALQPDGTMRFE